MEGRRFHLKERPFAGRWAGGVISSDWQPGGRPDAKFSEGALIVHVRFWGTRGSIAKPGPRTIRYGGNTSCVEVRSAAGALVVIDCGTGAHELGRPLMGTAPPGGGGPHDVLPAH